jgi:hypothetical protein
MFNLVMRVNSLFGNFKRWIRACMKMTLRSLNFLVVLILQTTAMMINGNQRTTRRSLRFKSKSL